MTVRIWVERLAMRLSRSRRSDGLWVGVLGDKSDDYLLDRVDDALSIIKQHDPARYRRVRRDVKRIWIDYLFGFRGEYDFSLDRCSLDLRFVRSAPTNVIASVIVHEATHAHPRLRKFGYPEALRYRIEQICMRQQLCFARKLPEGERVSEEVQRMLTIAPAFWSTESLDQTRLDGAFTAARSVGIPDWLTKSLLDVGKMHKRLRFGVGLGRSFLVNSWRRLTDKRISRYR